MLEHKVGIRAAMGILESNREKEKDLAAAGIRRDRHRLSFR